MPDMKYKNFEDMELMRTLGFVRTLGFDPEAQRLAVEFEAKPEQCHSGIVVAEGWVERMGSRTCFAEGLLRTRDGEVIAKAMSTISMVPMER